MLLEEKMIQKILLQEMLAEMRACIKKEDVKAGLPFDAGMTYDIEHIFIFWQQFRVKIDNLQKYISSLDYDIAGRVPWGDITFNSEEGFKDDIPVTRCWTCPKDCFAENREQWTLLYNIRLVSEGEFLSYFTSNTDKTQDIIMEGAEEAAVCPSPASTLIMLQTRAKDSLKIEQLKRNDFAVAHYREVESALGLKDTLPSSKRKRLFHNIRKIFRRK